MGTAVMAVILIGLVGVVVAGLFLWRRGALTVDTTKAKEAAQDLASDTKRDVSKWRDGLGK